MSDYFLEILDEQESLDVSAETIRNLAVRILEDAAVEVAKVSIVLVDNDTIHSLNRDFLQHDYPTDVLSFVLEEREHPRYVEGEIAVSVEMAVERAGEFGWHPECETLLYVVHGLLHMVGYTDETRETSRIMREKEAAYLAIIGVDVPHGPGDWDEEGDSSQWN